MSWPVTGLSRTPMNGRAKRKRGVPKKLRPEADEAPSTSHQQPRKKSKKNGTNKSSTTKKKATEKPKNELKKPTTKKTEKDKKKEAAEREKKAAEREKRVVEARARKEEAVRVKATKERKKEEAKQLAAEALRLKREKRERAQQEKKDAADAKAVVKAAPETAAKDLAWVAGIPQKDLRDLILQDLKNYQPAQAEDAVTIPQDEFYEACARALGRLFLDPYIERSRNGRSALDWLGEFLDEAAWLDTLRVVGNSPAVPPPSPPSGTDSFDARVLWRFQDLMDVFQSFYAALMLSCSKTRGMVDHASEVRRKWRLGALHKTWLGCVGGKFSEDSHAEIILWEWEKAMWTFYVKKTGDANEPSWDDPPASKVLTGAAAEKAYYVAGWAFFAATKVARRKEGAAKPLDDDPHRLARMAEYLRHDLAASPAPPQAAFVNEVERKEGRLLRPTVAGWKFASRLELKIQHWLTMPRLAVLGNSIVQRVEKQLLVDEELISLFDACFDWEEDAIVHAIGAESATQCRQLCRQLQALVIQKTMRSRASKFTSNLPLLVMDGSIFSGSREGPD